MAEFTKCGVCWGKPLPSGKPCICGGIGTEQAEMHGLRSALFDANDEITRLRAKNERLRKALIEAIPFIGYQDYVPDIVARCRALVEEDPHG